MDSAELVTIRDFELYARRKLPKFIYDYYQSGACDQQTLRDNEAAFLCYRLVPRMLRDVSYVQLNTTLLGHHVSMPICISPTAMQCMAHRDGECATARASRDADTCMTLSSWSTKSLEDVVAAAPDGYLWFQLYVYVDREVTEQLIRRAQASGYMAIVITVDTPLLGKRDTDLRNSFKLPSHLILANFASFNASKGVVAADGNSGLAQYVASLIDRSLNWDDIAWLKSITTLPIVVKGVLCAEDALLAVEAGAAGILVSNHGARQLDGVQATIDVLEEVVTAVSNRAEVYLDGGVRRGTDVLKALCLGARAVFIGRPVLWGLSKGGEAGVNRILSILRDETQLAMSLAGIRSVEEVQSNFLRRTSIIASKL